MSVMVIVLSMYVFMLFTLSSYKIYVYFIIFVFPILFTNEKEGEDVFLVVLYFVSLTMQQQITLKIPILDQGGTSIKWEFFIC